MSFEFSGDKKDILYEILRTFAKKALFFFVCIHDVVCTSTSCQTSRCLFYSTNRLSGKLRRKLLFTVIK